MEILVMFLTGRQTQPLQPILWTPCPITLCQCPRFWDDSTGRTPETVTWVRMTEQKEEVPRSHLLKRIEAERGGLDIAGHSVSSVAWGHIASTSAGNCPNQDPGLVHCPPPGVKIPLRHWIQFCKNFHFTLYGGCIATIKIHLFVCTIIMMNLFSI